MSVLWRGSLWQKLRLASGLVLLVFVVTHFINHALGLVDLETMNEFQQWRTVVTRSWLGSGLLIGALLMHMSLALARIARRRGWRMPFWEFLQMVSGVAIPFLLIPHFVATRVAYTMLDVNDTYAYELVQLWPHLAIEQSLLVLLVWLHASIGMHFWLRLAPWYPRIQGILLSIAVALPILALAGFSVAGREMALNVLDGDFVEELRQATNFPDRQEIAWLVSLIDQTRYVVYGLVGLAFLAYLIAIVVGKFRDKVTIIYADGPTLRITPGPTLLEISRLYGVPHASVCGGRARCSTCRVRIETGGAELPRAVDPESNTLLKVGAPPDVRLACQIRPGKEMKFIRVIRPSGTRTTLFAAVSPEAQGVERTLAVMFIDARGFTKMSESKLPYDVVFILNRLFGRLGDVIQANGGWIDKYLGDGLMAVFGREVGSTLGCRQALRAARELDLALDMFNEEMRSELAEPLAIGIGIHAGPMVLGRIGHENSAAMTVIGRTVNAAARLEALTKEKRSQLMVSNAVAALAGLPVEGYQRDAVLVRGLSEPIDALIIGRGRDLKLEAIESSETAA